MAVKKTELYSSLWASCDALRGGMDASQYKDYILTLLFMKYVTDKYKGQKYGDLIVFDKANDPNPDPEKRTGCSFDDFIALKNKKNIGEGIDKIIARLAEVNEGLKGVIDIAHFNDETKIGKNKEMVDKLTKLISIFQRPELDFSKNKAEGDDIIGDAYEYLMRNFASESGKSKGQFYTPAEVSRILAKIIGIDKCSDHDATVCDPACGSGSLLIRALEEAPFEISGYGQEKDSSTAGLAKMNAVLHNKATIKIMAGNTFSDPQFKKAEDASELERFDYIVANPPFSLKNWADGLKEFGRFSGYGDRPPEKNGDYAWLMHILKTLKSTGKAAVILPHGVLFRGNAEATIRQKIIDKGWIKGIISLPPNLFYGTGIPACIIVIDKEGAKNRSGIFMIDASKGYIKEGSKNRLREQDIYRIVTTFNEKITTDPKYARFVLNKEIKGKNEYNLNISRYIDSSDSEDIQDIYAHIHGGIPIADIDALEHFWKVFPSLKDELGLHTIPCRVKKGDFVPGWLGYYMNSHMYHNQILPFITGTKVSSISKSAIAGTLILVPPIEIQRSIVAVLSKVDELTRNERLTVDKLEAFKTAQLQAMFPRNDADIPEVRFPEFTDSWEQRKLKETIEYIVDNRGKNPDYYCSEGIPVIDNFMIRNSLYPDLNTATRFIDENLYQNFIRKYNEEDDILLTLVGNGIGNITLFPKDKAVIIQNTLGFRAKEDKKFLFFLLMANNEALVKLDRGMAQPSIRQDEILDLDIYVPSNSEQIQIGEYFTYLDNLITLHQHKCEKYVNIKKGMISELLVGNIQIR